MLIHLGEDKSVFSKDIIAILDLNALSHDSDFSSPSQSNPNQFGANQSEATPSKAMKSMLITASDCIYTPFTVQTLARRARSHFRNPR